MSGIAGVVVLNGICITLYLIGFAYRQPFISQLYENTFAKCSFEGLFISISSVGFILGMVARRRFLTRQTEIVLVTLFSIPLIIGAFLIHAATTHFSMPHSIKLADCTNNVVNIQLNTPKGHGYQFQLLTPDAQATTSNGSKISSYKFSGHIQILKGSSMIADLSLCADNVEFIESGYVLAGIDTQTNIVPLGQFLQPQSEYSIQISFAPPPSSSSSIVLYWLQSSNDSDK
jgi:hypothetical protein